jgi:hypothetical protein
MLRKRLKTAEAVGGPDIVVGFFKEANKYMAHRKKELTPPTPEPLHKCRYPSD